MNKSQQEKGIEEEAVRNEESVSQQELQSQHTSPQLTVQKISPIIPGSSMPEIDKKDEFMLPPLRLKGNTLQLEEESNKEFLY